MLESRQAHEPRIPKSELRALLLEHALREIERCMRAFGCRKRESLAARRLEKRVVEPVAMAQLKHHVDVRRQVLVQERVEPRLVRGRRSEIAPALEQQC